MGSYAGSGSGCCHAVHTWWTLYFPRLDGFWARPRTPDGTYPDREPCILTDMPVDRPKEQCSTYEVSDRLHRVIGNTALTGLPVRRQARAMCAAYPYHVAAEDVAELIASDAGDPEYLVSCKLLQRCACTAASS